MRKKTQETKELQGTFEPSKEFENVELTEWDGLRLPAASPEWPPKIQALWNDRCRDLQQAGYLAKAFLTPLRRYCFAVMMAEEAENKLIDEGFVTIEYGTKGQQYEVTSKWVSVLSEANKTIDRIGARFGFTPLDIQKIPAVKKQEATMNLLK
jgi:phage terminase small subunit